MSSSSSVIVIIQVGDRRFTTHKDTLMDGSEYFASKLSGRWDEEVQEDGSYFLDEEPEVFEHILRYLRRRIYPLIYDRAKGFDYSMYIRIMKTAEFLVIPELATWIKDKKYLQAIITTRSIHTYDSEDFSLDASSDAATSHSYHPTWQTEKIYVCPRGIIVHRGDKMKCGRQCANARGDEEDQFEEESVCKIMEVTEKTTFNLQVCMGE